MVFSSTVSLKALSALQKELFLFKALETMRIRKMGEPGTSVKTFVKATFNSSSFPKASKSLH